MPWEFLQHIIAIYLRLLAVAEDIEDPWGFIPCKMKFKENGSSGQIGKSEQKIWQAKAFARHMHQEHAQKWFWHTCLKKDKAKEIYNKQRNIQKTKPLLLGERLLLTSFKLKIENECMLFTEGWGMACP